MKHITALLALLFFSTINSYSQFRTSAIVSASTIFQHDAKSIRFTAEKKAAKSTNILNSIALDPNPCTDHLAVSMSNGRINSIYIYDISGALITAIKNENSDAVVYLNTEFLSKGIYLVSAFSDSEHATAKLVVQ
jgi:hypothetical protein